MLWLLIEVDDDSVSIHDAFAVAQDAMVAERVRSGPKYAAALAEVAAFVHRHRLQVRPDAEVLAMLANVVVTIDDLGFGEALGTPRLSAFDGLLQMVLPIAEFEVGSTREDVTRAEQMEYTVVGTITFEVAYAALRRMALEHASAIRFGGR